MTWLAYHSEVTRYLKNLHLYLVDREDSYSTSLKDYGLHCVQGGVYKRRMNFHLYSASRETPIRLRSKTTAFAILRVEFGN